MRKSPLVTTVLWVLVMPVIGQAQSIPPTAPLVQVEIRADLPPLPDSLPVYGRQPKAADEVQKIFQDLLERNPDTQGLRLQRAQDSLVVRDEKTQATIASLDTRVGELHIYPPLRAVKGGAQLDDSAIVEKVARPQIGRLFSDQLGQAALGPRWALRHARSRINGQQETQGPSLLYVSAEHRVDALAPDSSGIGAVRVEGPGARSLLVFDAQGTLVGASGNFRDAVVQRAAKPAFSSLKEELARQLAAIEAIKLAEVLDVDLVYYDAGKALVQPAYRYLARLTPTDATSPLHIRYVVGYVGYADTGEALPSLRGNVDLPVRAPDALALKPGLGLSVARYVARNTDFGFIQDASDLWSGMSANSVGTKLVDAGLYWSEPRFFLNDTASDTFLYRPQLVVVEGHGLAGGFATDADKDLVNIGEIPAPARPDASFRHWWLHSCDVIATPDERKDWAEPWWKVLTTESSAAGYRTPMYINDGAGAAYGGSLGNNAPVRSAWLADVASLEAYADNPHGCQDHLFTPFGRPAVVAACDTADQGLAGKPQSTSATKVECLDVWWLADPPSVTNAPPPQMLPPGDVLCSDGGIRGVVTGTQTTSCENAQCQNVGHCGGECRGSECVALNGC